MISEERRESYDKLRAAILDTYDAAQQVARGALSPTEAELIGRRVMDVARECVAADGEIFGRMRDGEPFALVADNDLALEQLAHTVGGYTEAHALLKRSLSWEDLTDAGEGYAREHSDLAEQRLREEAYQKLCLNRDAGLVAAGQMTQDEFARVHLHPHLAEPVWDEEAQVYRVPDEPEPARQPISAAHAAELGDMANFVRMRDAQDRADELQEYRRQLALAGYNADGSRAR